MLVNSNLHVPYPLESMCDNEDIILSNIRGVKISSPDVCNDSPSIYIHILNMFAV